MIKCYKQEKYNIYIFLHCLQNVTNKGNTTYFCIAYKMLKTKEIQYVMFCIANQML